MSTNSGYRQPDHSNQGNTNKNASPTPSVELISLLIPSTLFMPSLPSSNDTRFSRALSTAMTSAKPSRTKGKSPSGIQPGVPLTKYNLAKYLADPKPNECDEDKNARRMASLHEIGVEAGPDFSAEMMQKVVKNFDTVTKEEREFLLQKGKIASPYWK
jgi:hypothetical protein